MAETSRLIGEIQILFMNVKYEIKKTAQESSVAAVLLEKKKNNLLTD